MMLKEIMPPSLSMVNDYGKPHNGIFINIYYGPGELVKMGVDEKPDSKKNFRSN
ncbi:MAG: hypothetical protein CM15mP70_11280 [Pelagibacteraceae bacterium]|nr:MAG: hypothetical protein CM15mP70_11280 [Pelagibacteraceae bacterium]